MLCPEYEVPPLFMSRNTVYSTECQAQPQTTWPIVSVALGEDEAGAGGKP